MSDSGWLASSSISLAVLTPTMRSLSSVVVLVSLARASPPAKRAPPNGPEFDCTHGWRKYLCSHNYWEIHDFFYPHNY